MAVSYQTKKSDLVKTPIDNLETLFGDIELVTFKCPDIVSSSVPLEEKKHISSNLNAEEASQKNLTNIVCEVPHLGSSSSSVQTSKKGFVHYQDNVAEEAVMIARAVMEVTFQDCIVEFTETPDPLRNI